ncbi:MAG: DNA-directed RNA polymerase subunit beta [bacterium]
MKDIAMRKKKYFSKYKKPLVEFPNLIENQLASYKWLVEQGLKEVFNEFTPIKDYSEKKFELEIVSFTIGEPKFDEEHARINKLTYEVPIKVRFRLLNKITGSTKEQEIFLSDLPMMTTRGTFVINGVERVIVPQLARSAGVFFIDQDLKGKRVFGAKVIPARGVWMEIETEQDGTLAVRIDKKRKFPITSLLRVMGYHTDEAIMKAFAGTKHEALIALSIEKDTAKNLNDSYVEIYKRLRDGDLATADNAKGYIDSLFGADRYDISPVGRFRLNQQLGKPTDKKALEQKLLTKEDLAMIVSHTLTLNITPNAKPDDIDHLGKRRVKFMGEMIQAKVRVGMTQIKRNVQDRMSTIDVATAMPMQIINQRPLQARIKEFFTTNQLSQFMDQENVLAETEHLRRLSALGSGGLTRERASLEVRDVHTSHYGRVCPIQTPEGPNIGLVVHLATYAKINEFGIIETPYAKVKNGKITSEIVYLNALEEEEYTIAHAALNYDDKGVITDEYVGARVKTIPGLVKPTDLHFVDVATNQPFSIAASMIPFLDHDDANRSLMGSNMQRQAVPCIRPEAPLVSTGMEELAAKDCGRMVLAAVDGEVVHVDSAKVIIEDKQGKKHTQTLKSFSQTNGFNAFNQRPIVSMGQKLKKGMVIADASSTDGGQMAIGQNAFVAFMPWNGQNYEDAIIISERLIKNSKFTSVHIEEYVCTVRDTKLGPEVTTRDIPNVGEVKLKDLDEDGIVRVGAELREGDILVGKITPKGETELTPEERLLRSIFAEKARDVKDTSMRLDKGARGRVVGVRIFSREQGHNLESGIIKKIIITVAQIRNISVGDKLAGRHGNKGVISVVLPEEDMPYMADGTPVDVVLTPLGVPSRMNLGQVLELHLGMAAQEGNYQAVVPIFGGATAPEIMKELGNVGLPEHGRIPLFDGRTGEQFENEIAVGYMYILKLHHMVEDKIHMRSIGPYSLITQQPLGGKAQGGGQRFGEMEVWALEGYGVSHVLREMITVKSDDILGRSATYDAIIKGEPLPQPNAPASFSVMLNYLRGLALHINLKKKK